MTKVKICGLSSPQAVQTALDSGADFIGFVLAPSKRQVTIQQAQELARPVKGLIKIVGVFVSPTLEEVQEAVEMIPLDMVQIHGECQDQVLKGVSVPLIRAIQVSNRNSLKDVTADYLLFDAPVAGSGKTFDWSQIDPSDFEQPFFVAGGLTAQNVNEAIKTFHPYAVDVSSGVETDGKKDLDKIREFIESVKR